MPVTLQFKELEASAFPGGRGLKQPQRHRIQRQRQEASAFPGGRGLKLGMGRGSERGERSVRLSRRTRIETTRKRTECRCSPRSVRLSRRTRIETASSGSLVLIKPEASAFPGGRGLKHPSYEEARLGARSVRLSRRTRIETGESSGSSLKAQRSVRLSRRTRIETMIAPVSCGPLHEASAFPGGRGLKHFPLTLMSLIPAKRPPFQADED